MNSQPVDERKGHTHASNAEADALCPGRHLAQKELAPEQEQQAPDAAYGQRLHVALAKRDPAGLTLEQRETYDRCLEIESRKLTEFFGDEKFKGWSEDPDHPEQSRMWVKFKHDGRLYEHSCRPDRFYISVTRALVIEYKSLAGDVPESPENLQLRDQQVIIRGHFLIPGDIGVVVVQPLVEMDPKVCVYGPDESERARREMFARIVASNDAASARVAGELQCKYCRAKRHCSTYQSWAGQITPPAMVDVSKVPMASWTPEQRATVANALKPAQDLLDEIKEFFKQGCELDPNFIPGWALEPGRRRETISNPQVCFDRFAAMGGKLDQFMGCITVGKTKLKEQVSSVTGTRGKALEKAMAELTADIVKTSVDSPILRRKTGDGS